MQKISNRGIFGAIRRLWFPPFMPFRRARIRGRLVLTAMLVLLGAAPASAAQPASSHEQIFIRNCAVCHGEKGDGMSRAQTGLNPPPRDFTTARSAQELDRERMIESVRHGRPGTAMVAWEHRLSEDEIAGVVDFIRERFMRSPAATTASGAASVSGSNGRAVPAAAVADAGARIYQKHCSTCHGERGSGVSWATGSFTPPPRDFTAPGVAAELSLERMLASVTHGRPGTAMMAFGSRLSAEEIGEVVAYIRGEFMKAEARTPSAPAATPAAPVLHAGVIDMSLPFAGGLRGNADRGGAFYRRNCHVCHGLDGDGKGPRASFIRPPPRDFLSALARGTLNRPNLFEAISSGRRGTVMAAWKTVLSEQEIADVAEFVFQNFIQPSADAVKKKAGP
jgi:mono/diheme cytochrome c family protein